MPRNENAGIAVGKVGDRLYGYGQTNRISMGTVETDGRNYNLVAGTSGVKKGVVAQYMMDRSVLSGDSGTILRCSTRMMTLLAWSGLRPGNRSL